MEEEKLHIALLQTDLSWQNHTSNIKMFDGLLKESCKDVDLVVLPEMFATGFTMNAAENAEEMNGQSVTWMKKISEDLRLVVTGSLIIKENGNYFNRLIWANNGEIEGWYDKRHLFRMAGEHEVFSAGSTKKTFELKGWRILPLVCYDLRFPVWSRSVATCDLMLFVANWPAARNTAWSTLLRARAIENQCYVAGLNRIGTDAKNIEYSGNSSIIDARGEYIEAPVSDKPKVLKAALSLKDLENFREKFPVHLDADDFSIVL